MEDCCRYRRKGLGNLTPDMVTVSPSWRKVRVSPLKQPSRKREKRHSEPDHVRQSWKAAERRRFHFFVAGWLISKRRICDKRGDECATINTKHTRQTTRSLRNTQTYAYAPPSRHHTEPDNANRTHATSHLEDARMQHQSPVAQRHCAAVLPRCLEHAPERVWRASADGTSAQQIAGPHRTPSHRMVNLAPGPRTLSVTRKRGV